jgi:hypothetical protein
MGGHTIVVLLVESAEASIRSGVAMTALVVGGKSDMVMPENT